MRFGRAYFLEMQESLVYTLPYAPGCILKNKREHHKTKLVRLFLYKRKTHSTRAFQKKRGLRGCWWRAEPCGAMQCPSVCLAAAPGAGNTQSPVTPPAVMYRIRAQLQEPYQLVAPKIKVFPIKSQLRRRICAPLVQWRSVLP